MNIHIPNITKTYIMLVKKYVAECFFSNGKIVWMTYLAQVVIAKSHKLSGLNSI